MPYSLLSPKYLSPKLKEPIVLQDYTFSRL